MLRPFLVRHCLFVALVLTCWQSNNFVAAEFNVIERLHTDLLRSYNKQIRPVYNHTQALDVEVSMKLTSYDFNELESRFSARGFFYMSWKDPRFTWSPEYYDGLESIHLPSKDVWVPDLEVYNSPGFDRTFTSSNIEVFILSNGTVFFVPIANLISACIPNPTSYPFDGVTCSINVGSWTHNALKMNMKAKDNETKVDTAYLVSPRISQWNLVDTSVTISVKKYDCCPEPYQMMALSFTVKRSLTTATAVTTPAIALAILTLATFLIPPAVGARVLVGVFNLAILCAYMLYFHSILPSGTANTPLIVSFYNQSLILVIISVVTSIIALRWIKLAKSIPLPAVVQKLLESRMGLIMGAYQHENDNFKENELLTEKKIQQCIKEYTKNQQMWTNLFLAVDRIMMLVYCVVFALYLQCYFG